jgi:hypothetical protein
VIRLVFGRAAVIVATVALAATVAATARADGDPASDYLVTQNVYVPYRSPSQPVRSALERAADDVYLGGERVKLALIYDPTDLGSVSSLFGRPSDYAHFLGLEIGLWYVGPLIVLMPGGFGVYDGGRSTAAEEKVLGSVHVDAGSPDDFARSATTALQRLEAAGALASADIKAPLVTAHPASARRGRRTTLRFDVFDDSGRSRTIVRIFENRSLLATRVSPMTFKIGTRNVAIRWRVPAKLRSRRLRFCVVAFDPAGNQSGQACAPFIRVS